MKNYPENIIQSILRTLLCIVFLLVLSSCGGGFLTDNENASEFKNSIFNTDNADSTEYYSK